MSSYDRREADSGFLKHLISSEDFTRSFINESDRLKRAHNLNKLLSDTEIAEMRNQIWEDFNSDSRDF